MRLILIRTGPEFIQGRCNAPRTREWTRAGFTYFCRDGRQYYNNSRGEEEVVTGYRSILRLEAEPGSSVDYDAIERGNGFNSVIPGTYSARMVAPARRIIRIYGNFLIHASDVPGKLDGCIAPGREKTPNGVGHSREALDEILEAFGGWARRRAVPLVVQRIIPRSQARTWSGLT